jgi:hypothetical protein
MPYRLPHLAPVGGRLQAVKGHDFGAHAHIHAAVLSARLAQHLPAQGNPLCERQLRRLLQHAVAPDLQPCEAYPARLLHRLAQRVARRFANRLFVGRLPLGDPFGFHHQRLVRRRDACDHQEYPCKQCGTAGTLVFDPSDTYRATKVRKSANEREPPP